MTVKTLLAVAALSAIVVPSISHATTVLGATKITVTDARDVTDPGDAYLQVAELIATQTGTGTDVALASNGGSASSIGGDWPGSSPAYAIDGIYPSAFPNIYHSAGSGPGYELDIALGAPANLSSLTIYGRTDCCSERDDYIVTIYNAANDVLFTGELDGSNAGGGPTTVDFATGVPEPATWAMMLVGFGGLGAVMRGARRKAIATA
jgi:hypothetical protein